MNHNIENIKKLCSNLIYISENNYSVVVKDLPIRYEQQIIHFILQGYSCKKEDIKKIEPHDFFARFHRAIDKNDLLLQENAAKFRMLEKLLVENFAKLFIYRIEKSTIIPILIFGSNNTGDILIFLETFSEET